MTNYEKPIQAKPFDAAFSPDPVQVIWRRKWWLAGCLLISLALGAAYLTRVEPSYRVQSRVLVQQHGLPLDQKRPSATSEEFLATQAEIIRSPAVVGRAAESLEMTPRGDPPIDPTTWILESLSVIPVTGTYVLSISFVGPDAEQATRTVEAIIVAYREYLLGSDHDTHLEALRTLTQNEKDLREELQVYGLQYQQLRKDSPLMGHGRDAAAVQRSLLTDLGERLTEVRSNRIALENRVHTLAQATGPVLVSLISERPPVVDAASAPSWRGTFPADSQAADDPFDALLSQSNVGFEDSQRSPIRLGGQGDEWGVLDTRLIEQELFRAQADQRALAQDYGHKHPEVRRVRERIAAWQDRFQERLDAAPLIMRQKLTAIRLQEQQLDTLYQEEFAQAKTVDSFLIKEQQSLDGIHRLQSIHDSVLTQLTQFQMADQARSKGLSAVKVGTLEAPDTAERLLFPPPSLLMAVCGVIGLIGGFGLVTLLERIDPKVQRPGTIPIHLNRSSSSSDEPKPSQHDQDTLPLRGNMNR